jgi:hypothetical protein
MWSRVITQSTQVVRTGPFRRSRVCAAAVAGVVVSVIAGIVAGVAIGAPFDFACAAAVA